MGNILTGNGEPHREDYAKLCIPLLADGKINHESSLEYAFYIMEVVVTNKPFQIGGNVLNNGLNEDLPADACVEVLRMVDGNGINPCTMEKLPVQLATMNMSNINVQMLTIDAAVTKKREFIR